MLPKGVFTIYDSWKIFDMSYKINKTEKPFSLQGCAKYDKIFPDIQKKIFAYDLQITKFYFDKFDPDIFLTCC